MKFEVQREKILKPLQLVSGIVEKKHTQPILSNILLSLESNKLTFTATDQEMEVIATIDVESSDSAITTVPVRKFLDTCKTLEEGSQLKFSMRKEKAVLTSNKTRFTLTTLSPEDFPVIDAKSPLFSFFIPQKTLKRLIDKTSFAMAIQDVRYYLNGLLFEITPSFLRVVATDGHRLAVCGEAVETNQVEGSSIVIPRKAVLEMARILEDSDENVSFLLQSWWMDNILITKVLFQKIAIRYYPLINI